VNPTRTPTADRHPADALLAAFVDGRLGGTEHRHLVEHLSTCESCREVVAETARTLRDPELAGWLDDDADGDEEEAEPSAGSSGVLVPAAGRFRRARPLIATLAAAAGIAALLFLTPTGREILGLGGGEVAVAELTAGLEGEAIQDYVADEGYEDGDHGWTVYAGTGTISEIDPETSFKAGVRVAELDVMLRLDEREAAATVVARLLAMVDSLNAAIYYTEIQQELNEGTDRETLLEYSRLGNELLRAEDRSDSLDWYDLGRWAAAGDLAALAEDRTWFRRSVVRRELRRMEKRQWPPEVSDPLAAIRDLMTGGVEQAEWNDLRQAFDALIEAGGNHDSWPEPPDSANEPAL